MFCPDTMTPFSVRKFRCDAYRPPQSCMPPVYLIAFPLVPSTEFIFPELNDISVVIACVCIIV